MVGMQVGDEDFIYRFEAHAHALGGYLGAFPAVDEYAVPLVAHHERGEPAIHQRQGAAGSQETDIEHAESFAQSPPICQGNSATRRWKSVCRVLMVDNAQLTI